MLTDAPPRKGSRVEFLESDRAKILDLPQNGSLPDIVRGLESAMKASVAPDVRKTCAGFWRLVVPGKTNVLGVGNQRSPRRSFGRFYFVKQVVNRKRFGMFGCPPGIRTPISRSRICCPAVERGGNNVSGETTAAF